MSVGFETLTEIADTTVGAICVCKVGTIPTCESLAALRELAIYGRGRERCPELTLKNSRLVSRQVSKPRLSVCHRSAALEPKQRVKNMTNEQSPIASKTSENYQPWFDQDQKIVPDLTNHFSGSELEQMRAQVSSDDGSGSWDERLVWVFRKELGSPRCLNNYGMRMDKAHGDDSVEFFNLVADHKIAIAHGIS